MAAKKKSRKTPATSASKRTPKSKKSSPAKAGARRSPRRRGADAAVEDRVGAIQRVIDVMVAAGAVEVELEEEGRKLRVRLKEEQHVVSYAPPPVAGALPSATSSPSTGSAAAADAAPAPAEDPRRQVFVSPMVGTFYRASSPDAEPYCEVGDHVSPDTTVCILEAMKVMNEIKAEMSGEILEILAQNGEPVEFGQPLLVIRVD